MLICRIALVASLVACLSYCALALDPATKLVRIGTPTTTNSATPLVSMTHTAGWGNGVVRSFTLNKDGSFTWAKGGKREKSPLTLVGKLSQEDVKSLIEKLQAAGEGPGAEDAGYVAIEFVNSDGKLEKKSYSMPGAQPAASLLALIDELAQKNGKPQATTMPAIRPAMPLVSMTHTGGNGGGVERSFTLKEDGGFTWTKGGKRELSPQTLVGKLSEEEVKSFTDKIRSAGPGPSVAMMDAGGVTIEFINSDGKLEKKDYSMPGAQPAASLLALIDELAQKNGKPQGTTMPATNPAAGAATNPTSKPSEISQDDARKIAEETLIRRKTDPSALSYNGTTLFTDADGKKFWRVSYGPKQPPQVEGQPRAMISGGQVMVLVAVDTGETKMLFGM